MSDTRQSPHVATGLAAADLLVGDEQEADVAPGPRAGAQQRVGRPQNGIGRRREVAHLVLVEVSDEVDVAQVAGCFVRANDTFNFLVTPLLSSSNVQ
mgnify:CR=1 FL=1